MKNRIITKIISRFVNPIIWEAVDMGSSVELKKVIGKGFDITLVLYQGKTTDLYRKKDMTAVKK